VKFNPEKEELRKLFSSCEQAFQLEKSGELRFAHKDYEGYFYVSNTGTAYYENLNYEEIFESFSNNNLIIIVKNGNHVRDAKKI